MNKPKETKSNTFFIAYFSITAIDYTRIMAFLNSNLFSVATYFPMGFSQPSISYFNQGIQHNYVLNARVD